MEKQELKKALDSFSKIDDLHPFNPLKPNVFLSDGAKFLSQSGHLYWLMDIIAFGVGWIHEEKAVAYMKVDRLSLTVKIMVDYPDGRNLYSQTIGIRPSPFDVVLLKITKKEANWIISLMDEVHS